MKTILKASCKLITTISIAIAFALPALHEARGSVSYSAFGADYTQNFDSLPNTPENTSLGSSPAGWIDDTAAPDAGNFSIVGWYLYHPTSQSEGGFNNHQRMRIGAGTSSTGAFMSFGASGSTDRALGDVGSNTMAPTPPPELPLYIGLRLHNDTGIPLDRFTLSYYGEQWRDGGNSSGGSTPQTMDFMWSTTAAAIDDPDTAFTTVAALDFTSPVYGATSGAAVDGNGVGRVSLGPITVTGIIA